MINWFKRLRKQIKEDVKLIKEYFEMMITKL